MGGQRTHENVHSSDLDATDPLRHMNENNSERPACRTYPLVRISTGKPCVLLKRKKAESEAQRGKPKGTLESESRNAIV